MRLPPNTTLEAEIVSKENNLADFIGKVWGNIAANHVDTKNYGRSAWNIILRDWIIWKEHPSVALTRQYNNIGVVYDNMENFKDAKLYYTRALQNSKKFGEPQLVGLIVRNLGELHMVEEDYGTAEKFIEESIIISKKVGSPVRLIRGYMKMAEVQAALGNYKSAYQYDRLFTALKDSVRGIEVRERINDLEIKYQTEKKEAALALQDEEIKTLK